MAERGRQMLRWLQNELRFEPLPARPMGEMAALLRTINRIATIHTTSFVPLVYRLALAGITLLCDGLKSSVSERISDAFFFVGVIAFLLLFLLLFLLHLIDDLDHPFGNRDPDSAEDVSLVLQQSVVARLEATAARPQA